MKPLFIWAGGKTRVLKHYAPFMPSSFETYYEPFFGGGAMFVHVMNTYQPKNVVINDINDDVMNIYREIKTNLGEFQQRLDSLESQYLPLSKDDRKKFYFDIRHLHAWDYQEWSKTFEAAQNAILFDEDWVQWDIPTEQEYQREIWYTIRIAEPKG